MKQTVEIDWLLTTDAQPDRLQLVWGAYGDSKHAFVKLVARAQLGGWIDCAEARSIKAPIYWACIVLPKFSPLAGSA